MVPAVKAHLFSRPVTVLLMAGLASACSLSSASLEYKRGEKAAQKNQYEVAVKHFKKVILREPESDIAVVAARHAARITQYEMKNFLDAISFYEHLVNFSKSERERREAQVKIANLYFEKLNNYSKAIEEYNKILLLKNANEEIVDYRFALGKAHFYLHHFQEALNEIQRALKIVEDANKKFELLMFLGNIHFNTKKADEAIKIYKQIMADYPERAARDNVAMNIIVCHEELEEFDQAISKLEKLRSNYNDPEFIDLKIKRLRDRKDNLPGSKGLRK